MIRKIIGFVLLLILNVARLSLSLPVKDLYKHNKTAQIIPINNSLIKDRCYLCPSEEYVDPCACLCTSNNNILVVTLYCTLGLEDQDTLHDILQQGSFRDDHVYKLAVVQTTMSGTLSDELFSPISITDIEFTYNNINYIDSHAFKSSANTLKYLDLRYNEICFYAWQTLKENKHLISLKLDHNMIENIPSESLSSESLLNISISYNNINYLGSKSFMELHGVQYIDLSHNKISSLNEDSLSFYENNSLTHRMYINLSYNNISSIHTNAFNAMKPATVDLRYNQIEYLPESIFGKLFVDLMANVKIKVNGNPLECDCSFAWIMRNFSTKNLFDDFFCSKQNQAFGTMKLSDLGDCS